MIFAQTETQTINQSMLYYSVGQNVTEYIEEMQTHKQKRNWIHPGNIQSTNLKKRE